jgi:oxygen-independent coproporphyrinogen-3 oxidase
VTTSPTIASPLAGWPAPRAVYIHVPFCRHRCGYCNFSVVAGRDDLVARFLDAIDCELAPLDCPSIDTVFIGGGTPTHLSNDQLQRLLDLIRARFDLVDSVEWTVEANPEDIDDRVLAILRNAGVNRLSLGVQSFDDQKLNRFERGHSGDEAVAVIEQVAAQIPNLSIDLIFGCPGESLRVWQSDLDTALALPISHLSTYSLTFEKGTSFWNRRRRGQLTPVTESLEVEMFNLTRQKIVSQGMPQYEISSFARPGMRCRHNIVYWEGRGWFAAGPGAARFVGGRREVNHRSTTTYLKRIESGICPTAERDVISPEEHARERAAFGIRMIDGIDLSAISADTGVDLKACIGAEIERFIQSGWLTESAGRVQLTEQGVLFADAVARDLLG